MRQPHSSISADPQTQPVLNRPWEEPGRHWKLGDDNRATGEVLSGRRRSAARVIVPKARATQQPLPFTPGEPNELVNRIRAAVGKWRSDGYPDSTAATQRLLDHWHSESNDLRLFFAEVEAAETLIWLVEANAARYPELGEARKELSEENAVFNAGIGRQAVKMATGSGKTVVIGMIIAWQVVNAATSHRRDHRYTTSFLAITPGHTVRERLSVIDPSTPDNVYRELRLVPEGDMPALGRARVSIVNYQALQPRDRLADMKSSDAKKLLRAGSPGKEPETYSALFDRILRGLPSGRRAPRVCVLNDEAHHCYLPTEGRRTSEDDDSKAAAVWFAALEGLRDSGRLGPVVYDFSATPIFIESGERRERLFPWVVSDYPLLDAVESGLVKIPQVPVDDDSGAAHVEWRNLYESSKRAAIRGDQPLPPVLGSALRALYRSYESKFQQWTSPDPPGVPMPTPPVLIVVANSITNAISLSERIAGRPEPRPDGSVAYRHSEFDLFANYTAAGPTEQLHTLLVHSKPDGDITIEKASQQVMQQQAARLRRHADATLDDASVIRRALNSVGRPGGVGEHIRCVVSVSMLTEGWDTRTVTHILGYRAFSTQLLCEQVTGRALRRSNYDNFDDDGRLVPEYAEVIGVPFEFMRDRFSGEEHAPPKPRYEVYSVPGRAERRVEFPNVTSYLMDMGSEGIHLDETKVQRWQPSGATEADLSGIVGTDTTISAVGPVRRQTAITRVAAAVVARWVGRLDEAAPQPEPARRSVLFGDATKIVERWMALAEVQAEDWGRLAESLADEAAGQIILACEPTAAGSARIIANFGHPPVLHTGGISFETSLTNRHYTKRSELNVAACHTSHEAECAVVLDDHPDVSGWARNFRLGWTVPYEWQGRWRGYEPDFVARLFGNADSATAAHLLVEFKGQPDELSEAKKLAVVDKWIPALENDARLPRRLRRWSFVEVTDTAHLRETIDKAISAARDAHGTAHTMGAA